MDFSLLDLILPGADEPLRATCSFEKSMRFSRQTCAEASVYTVVTNKADTVFFGKIASFLLFS